jgi:plastocyanin
MKSTSISVAVAALFLSMGIASPVLAQQQAQQQGSPQAAQPAGQTASLKPVQYQQPAEGITLASQQVTAERTTGKSMAAQPAAVVDMTDSLKFEPRTVEIKQGSTVLWKNASNLVHTVTADPELANNKSNVQLPQGAETFHSGDIAPGEEYRHTFNVPGRYRYFCVPHEAAGMIGEVIVK